MNLPEIFTAVLRASCLGSVAVLLLLAVRRVAGKSLSPGARCWLWLPVAILFVMPRLPDLGWHWQTDALPEMVQKTMRLDFQASPVATHEAAEPQALSSVKAVGVASWMTSWTVLSSVWIGGALCLLTLWLVSYGWLLRKIDLGKTAAPESLRALLAACARESGLRHVPRLIVSEGAESPAVAGLLRPAVLLPTALGDLLEKSELRFVLLHEVGHLKRRDLWCHWISALLLAVHWFNPLLWLAMRLFRADREAACDAAVLASHREDARGIYGSTLLKLQSHFVRSLPLRPMIGLLGGTDMLRQRILDIAHYGRGSRWAGRGAWLLMVGVVVGIAVMAEEPLVVKKDAPGSESISHDQVAAPEGAAGQETREETLRRIDALAGVVERQISISVKVAAIDPAMSWVTLFSDAQGSTPLSDPPVGDNLFVINGVFTDPQVRIIMRALNQKKGVDILTMPTITARSGLTANVKLVKNMRYPTEFKPGENGKPAQVSKTTTVPLGWSLEVEPIAGVDGKTIDLNIKIESNAFEKWETYGPGVKQPVLQHGEITTSVSLNDGFTIGLGANGLMHDMESFATMNPEDPPAARERKQMIFITPKLIDPAGRPGPWKEEDNQGIVIPEVRLENVSLPEAINQIGDLAKKNDRRRKGVNLMLRHPAADDSHVTLKLTNVKLSTLLDLFAKLAHLDLEVEGEAVMLDLRAEEKEAKPKSATRAQVKVLKDPVTLPATIGQKSFLKGDHIEILHTESTSGKFEVGDRVIVKGRYQLTSHDAASICLFTTQTDGDGREETDPGQKTKAEKGAHDFELSCTIRKKGYLHVSFYDLEHGDGFGCVYFGSAQQMQEFDVGDWPAQPREKKGSPPLRAPDEPAPRFVPNRPFVTPTKP